MNEFDDIDRDLAAAFTQRPSTLSRPSLRDVKQRARRHQRQRKAGVLSACALVGVGGVAVIAQRSPGNQTTAGGLDDPSTTMCLPATTSTIPGTTIPGTTIEVYDSSTVPTSTGPATEATTEPTTLYTESGTYIIKPGDNPTDVAQRLGISLELLNAANTSTPGYETFAVGLEIAIPGVTGPSAGYAGIAGVYTLVEGDFPGLVAEKFHVTVEALDAANDDVAGYGGFIVGTVINIPVASYSTPASTLDPSQTTTTAYPPLPADATSISCAPFPNNQFRCSGEPQVGDDGWWYFEYCEATYGQIVVNDQQVVPTMIPPNLTKIGTSVQVVNTSNQEGVAGYLSEALAAEGFTMVEPDTGTIDLPITKVFYNPDDPNALPVAQTLALFLGNAVVEASGPVVPTLTLGTWAPGSSVIVLLGDDLAGKTLAEIAGQSTTTTCAGQSQITLPPPATTTTYPGC